jgi:proline iminopeptidase
MTMERVARRWLGTALLAIVVPTTTPVTPSAQPEREPSGLIPVGDGVSLFYRVDGAAANHVVVLHGGPGLSMAYLQPDLGPLAKARRVISYDQRGAGRSTVTSDPALVNLTKHVDDLEAVRRFFSLERVTIVGHSWGAALALHYALRFPDRVARLLLVGAMPPRQTPYFEQFGNNLRTWMDEPTRAELARLTAARRDAADPVSACRAYWGLFIRGYLADPHKPLSSRGDVCDAPAEAVRNSGRVNALTVGPLGDWDWRPLMASVKAPTLVVHGERDPIPMAAAREWAAAIPNARLLVIPGSGHFPYIEQPQSFFRAAEQFLAGQWPANAEARGLPVASPSFGRRPPTEDRRPTPKTDD